MSILWNIIACVWTIRILGNVLAYAYLWRIKEYRSDRMVIHLKTRQGSRILFPAWRRPAIAPKTFVVIIGTLCLLVGLYSVLPFPLLWTVLILDVLTFPLTWLIVSAIQIPTQFYHGMIITKARQKLASCDELLVIGITGSFGKTSVKEYLATILSKKFNVLKTEASQNSPIGIAEVINKSLTAQHEVFVVEMGAYKKGEIAFMSDFVRPQIGMVTAINPQHQDLFGSIENTMEAKYELIAGLSGKNIALFNMDYDRTVQMSQWAKKDQKNVWFWSKVGNAKIDEPLFWADGIVTNAKGIQFTCHFGRKKHVVKVRVLGEHQVANITAAIAAAVACGMDFEMAAKAASSIVAAKKVMEAVEGVNGSVFINDTFNNNPDAAKAAIAYLGAQSGKKILVFQPMIELGKFAKPSHTDVGAAAAKVADTIILTNENFYHDFEMGVRSVSQTVPLLVLPAASAAVYIKERVSRGDTVLFKGKEAEPVLKALIPHTSNS